MNPLARYREAQRRVRGLFDPFTRENCPTCATPCCQKPARIRPVDLVLVEELGFPLPPQDATASLVKAALGGSPADAGAPCDYLGPAGCAFPADLRPFGCAAFICTPMRRSLHPQALARVEEAVAALEAAHTELMDAIHNG